MTRTPVVQGMFYESDPMKLTDQIKSCFTHKLGPGILPDKEKSKNNTIRGAIIPHAGFFYSGPCAAHTYKAIAEAKKPKTVILLAPNHTGMGRTSLIMEDYQTPLGNVEVDRELAKIMLKKFKKSSRRYVCTH
jgi:AmmeMemoRadiSam system protein B